MDSLLITKVVFISTIAVLILSLAVAWLKDSAAGSVIVFGNGMDVDALDFAANMPYYVLRLKYIEGDLGIPRNYRTYEYGVQVRIESWHGAK